MEWYGVMGGANNAKLGKNRSFRKMAVVDKKGGEAEGMERRGVGEGGGCTLKGRKGGNSLSMDVHFYQREVL